MREIAEHNHVVNPATVAAKIAVTQIRQRAETSRDPPRLVIQQATATLTDEAIAEVPEYKALQRMIERKRKLNGEPGANPRTIADINIPAQHRQTLRGENFLLHDSGEDDPGRFLIFGTQGNHDMLQNNRHWFADGTFKVAPQLFYQMHTIHTIHEHSVLPMLYVFLQSKQTEDYARVLATI